MERVEELLGLIYSENAGNIERLNWLVELSEACQVEGNMADALKYAALSTVCSSSPRADACVRMGSVYECLGNGKWAKFWYEKAVSNVPEPDEMYGLDSGCFTWIPMARLGSMALEEGDMETARYDISIAYEMAPTRSETQELLKKITVSE